MTIRAQGLSAVRSGRTILHPTNVELRPGERAGLFGVSGAGKSTLGHVLVDSLRARGTCVAHVPQSPDEALDPLRTMAFHWREAEKALGLAPDDALRASLFHALKIERGDLRKRPWGWSRGIQQRFVIAMALTTPDTTPRGVSSGANTVRPAQAPTTSFFSGIHRYPWRRYRSHPAACAQSDRSTIRRQLVT